MAPHGVYPCEGDDQWVAIAVHDDACWQRLCRAMGREALGEEPGLFLEIQPAHLQQSHPELVAGRDGEDEPMRARRAQVIRDAMA